ncbi:hypothetical protein [Thioalkalivibrio sp.]|uniref:hypothetical protein n=1 Tax=Thioalkalivibrio sp. TaxID=2093813 RepID=UPI003568C358
MARDYDSSKTRVKPVLDRVSATGTDWLTRLLALPTGGGRLPEGLDLTVVRKAWGEPEPSLPAPPGLLRWLVQNLNVAPPDADLRPSARMRRLLVQRDADTIRRALSELERDASGGNWWVLEGPTYPDALIETPDAVIVIEGKRTERGPTLRTTWMPTRHQMLRHMDAAWEYRGGRCILGFFIVEADDSGVPNHWRSAVIDTVAPETLSKSLPHRTPEEQAEIAAGFLGVTTWDAVCAEFTIDPTDLPETVNDLPPG